MSRSKIIMQQRAKEAAVADAVRQALTTLQLVDLVIPEARKVVDVRADIARLAAVLEILRSS